MNLFEADCCQGDDGHVKGIEERPVFDDGIAKSADRDDRDKSGDRKA